MDRVFRRIQPAEENRFFTRCIIDHLDMITRRWRLRIFLHPGLAIPFPGVLLTFPQVNGTPTIKDEHIPLLIISRAAQVPSRWTAFGDLLPLRPIPTPDHTRGLFVPIRDTVDEEHLLQL